MLQKFKNWLRSTKKATSTDIAVSKQQSKTDIISLTQSAGKCYTDIDILPLSKFIEIAVDGNLNALIKNGSPSDDDIIVAWDKIQQQYSDSMKDAEYSVRVHLLKDIQYLQLKYEQIQQSIDLLKRYYTKPIADLLNKYLLTQFKFDPTDTFQYEKDLKSANMRSKAILMRLEIQKSSYQKMIQGQETDEDAKITRGHFQGMLIALSNHVGYQIRDDISTYEYCKRVNDLNEYIEKNKPKPSGRGKN